MPATYKIHPGIGIARLGNSETEFYLGPETPAGLPVECDHHGNPKLSADGQGPVFVKNFKDDNGKIKRQAARFQIYVYDDKNPDGRPLNIGDSVKGGGNSGILTDIIWRVYPANKKSAWYRFQQLAGEHGYSSDHPVRNPDIQGSDRQRLIIDPGPRIVNFSDQRHADFDRNSAKNYAANFPPQDLQPFCIDTLGEMMSDDQGRLLFLGGHGYSGSYKTQPLDAVSIEDYADNDGWFDDICDGPVMARLVMYSELVGAIRYIDVEAPAWVIVGYPRFAPEIQDMVTLDELLYDMYLREFALDTYIYGETGSFGNPEKVDTCDPDALRIWKAGRLEWNPDYRPHFYRDIWPILFRADEFRYVCNILGQSNFPHDQEPRGTFDVNKLAQEPTGDDDSFKTEREFLYNILRLPGEENVFSLAGDVNSRLHNLPLMPLLAGDNPLTNQIPCKFLRLTDYQLFILKQWAAGRFFNEKTRKLPIPYQSPYKPYPTRPAQSGFELDRYALASVLGGAFCPGGEVSWMIRNPSIYAEPYRIKVDRKYSTFRQTAAQANANGISVAAYSSYIDTVLTITNDFNKGLQPGDITKYSALPWQSDFNECTTQDINITYKDWNNLNAESDNDQRLIAANKIWTTLWWPAHRPLQSYEVVGLSGGAPSYEFLNWSRGIPATLNGNLKMVSAWWKLGFVVRNPYLDDKDIDNPSPDHKYISIERDDEF